MVELASIRGGTVGGAGMTENEASVRLEVIRAGLLSGTDAKVVSSEENIKSIDAAIDAIEENQQYRAIGTPEECRAAVEKQTAKLVIDNTPAEDSVWYQCPTCKGDLTTIRGFYCQYCGQKLHWR